MAVSVSHAWSPLSSFFLMCFYEFIVHSTTQPKVIYHVVVERDPPRVWCDCVGYRSHGYCKHIKMYKALIERLLSSNPGF